MEGGKEMAPYSSSSSTSSSTPSHSSTSFTSELFGSKQMAPASSSENTFSSIFPPPSMVRPGEFPNFEVNERKQYIAEQGWNSNPGNSEDDLKSNNFENRSKQKDANYIYGEKNLQPVHLSSSIFYGGQEIYSHPSNDPNSASNSIPLENGKREDDSESASRGDWWQGSLYY